MLIEKRCIVCGRNFSVYTKKKHARNAFRSIRPNYALTCMHQCSVIYTRCARHARSLFYKKLKEELKGGLNGRAKKAG